MSDIPGPLKASVKGFIFTASTLLALMFLLFWIIGKYNKSQEGNYHENSSWIGPANSPVSNGP